MSSTQTASSLRVADRLGGVEEYYFSRKLREIAKRRAAGESILNLGIGNPDLPPPPGVVSALTTDVAAAGAHGYQGYRGIDAWRLGIAKWYSNTYRITLTDDEVLPLSGSKEGIAHLCLALLQQGCTVMFPDPGYPAYAAAGRLAGAQRMAYPMPLGDMSASEWAEQLDDYAGAADVRLIFVNSPHMPTGQVLSEAHLEALVAFAKTRGAVLVSDNAYGHYHPGGPRSLLTVAGARDVAVELNSLSKSHHMPGWRLGALVGRADVVQAALQVKSNLDSGQFRPVQAGAAEALTTPATWHTEQLSVIAQRRAVANDMLEALGCMVPTGQAGLFVWARVPAGAPRSETWCDALLDASGVFLPPGTVFGEAGEGYVRLSLCSPQEVLKDAARRTSTANLVHA